MAAVLIAVGVGAAHVGAAVIARHRAQATADLAALAAAARLPAGAENACAAAGRLAGAMAMSLAGCTVEGLDVVVTVHAKPGIGARWMGLATAVARAGPGNVPG